MNKKLFLLPVVAVLLTACTKPKEVLPESLTISAAGNVTTIIVGETVQLSASVLPAEASKEVVWSTNSTYLEVSASGLVTGKAVGSGNVYAVSKVADSVEASISIKVDPVPLVGIAKFYQDATEQTFEVEGIEGQITIKNSNGLVVDDGHGAILVYDNKAGTFFDNYNVGDSVKVGGLAAVYANSYQITKTEAVPITIEKITKTFTPMPSKTVTVADLVAYGGKGDGNNFSKVGTVIPERVKVVDALAFASGSFVNYKMDYTSGWTIAPQVLTPTVTVAANDLVTLDGYFLGVGSVSSKRVNMYVHPDNVSRKDNTAVPTSFALSETTISIEQGKTAAALAVTNIVPFPAVFKGTWSSDNTAVATVVDGKITGVAVGTTTVKATQGAVSASVSVTVTPPVAPAVTPVVISEIYGGGASTAVPLNRDFIELYNNTDQDINLTGWAIWYASATGEFKDPAAFDYDVQVALTGVIKAKSYYLIGGQTGTEGEAIPTPEVGNTLGVGASNYKIVLTNSLVVPTKSATGANVVDFVGNGTADTFEGSKATVATTKVQSISRTLTSGIMVDTNDNFADFTVGTPTPKNSVPA